MKNPNLAASSHGNIPHLKIGKVKPIKMPYTRTRTSHFWPFLDFVMHLARFHWLELELMTQISWRGHPNTLTDTQESEERHAGEELRLI